MRSVVPVLVIGVLLAAANPSVSAIECTTPRAWQPKLVGSSLDLNGNFIDDALEGHDPSEILDIIVDLNRCPEMTDLDYLSNFGDIVHVGLYISAVVLHGVRAGDLAQLAESEIVAFLELDRDVCPSLDVSNPSTGVRESSEYSPDTVEDLYRSPGDPDPVDGDGIVIAIIDSGIDDQAGGSGHRSLPAWKYVGGADCRDDPCDEFVNPDDEADHGTPVAGVALAEEDGSGGREGIAPAALLADIQTFTTISACPRTAQVTRAIEFALSHREAWGIDVLLLAKNCGVHTEGGDEKAMLLNRAAAEGIVPVASAGQKVAFVQRVKSPATADDAIAVGNACNDPECSPAIEDRTIIRDDDVIEEMSCEGPRDDDGDSIAEDEQKPDLSAPGNYISAPEADSLDGYRFSRGTSFAAAHVAGCVALLLDVNPTLTPRSIKHLLRATAEDHGDPGWDDVWGSGLLDCFAAVEAVRETPGTDLGFIEYMCHPGTDPPCWLSSEIWPEDPTIEEGERNVVHALVSNFGSEPVSNFQVRLGVYNFSNSDHDYDICNETILTPLAPGASVTVSCPYTPVVSGAPPGQVHACLKAEVVYPYDTDFSNNRAQHNVQIEQTSSPAEFNVGIVNPSLDELTMELDPYRCICWEGQPTSCPCPGWEITLSDNNFLMAADACPRNVVLTQTPYDPDQATRRSQVDLAVRGEDANGQTRDLLGVTAIAEIPCRVTGLHFPPAAPPEPPTANRRLLAWQSSPYAVCPGLFDVARGELPILTSAVSAPGGDFSEAECLEDDLGSTSLEDAEEPLPGDGRYYLVRVGGEDPGTWDTGTEVGTRDATLLACP